MLTLPSSRHYLVPALILFAFVFLLKTFFRGQPPSPDALLTRVLKSSAQNGIKIPVDDLKNHLLPIRNGSEAHLPPSKEHYYNSIPSPRTPGAHSYLAPLLTCALTPNPHTNHIRLHSTAFNITLSTADSPKTNPNQHLFNPAILALPPWSQHHYLLVSRVVTEGLHQESLICFADICHHPNATQPYSVDSRACSTTSLIELGPAGGLSCATPPIVLSIPPTPALNCEGAWSAFPSIPGFHDPRIFWSGKGEPLIIVNSASQYACVGLWMVDLRVLEPSLRKILDRTGKGDSGKNAAPIMSYPSLTELTRNPASDRGGVEKNWLLFFGSGSKGQTIDVGDEAFVHYDMFSAHSHGHGNKSSNASIRRGRSFAKLIGNGFTTENLTDSAEVPCLVDEIDGRGQLGHWHQASNALKLVLCTRTDARREKCNDGEERRVVNFAVVHRKFSNHWQLPLRYERYFVVWDARKPFHVLGVSKYPVLFWNETASGWNGRENWAEEMGEPTGFGWNKTIGRAEGRIDNETTYAREGVESSIGRNWAYFTYTPSINWAWRPLSQGLKRDDGNTETLRGMHVGYLDDEVMVGIGLDDTAQAYAKVKASTLLQCLRVCPEEDHDQAVVSAEDSVPDDLDKGKEEGLRAESAARKSLVSTLFEAHETMSVAS